MKDTRLSPLLGMLILVVVGVAVAVLGLPDRERNQSLTEPPAKVGRSGKPAALLPPPAAPDGAGFDEPQLEVQRVPEAPQVVDSFPPTRHVPLAGWNRTGTVAGYFDSLAMLDGNGRSPVVPDRTLDGNAILVASGWAGDPQLGLQLHDIVLSQCDRLIARARVALDRPDVADAVHPNLRRSGWEALLHAADLPICADTTMHAWAVLPGRPAVLLALNGTFRLGSVSAVEPAYHVSALPPLEAADIAPPVVTMIEVNAKRVNLRRCGGTDCPRVDQIEGGRHRVHIADRSGGWSLLVFKDRAGWMTDTLYKLAE